MCKLSYLLREISLIMKFIRYSAKLLKKKEYEDGDRMVKLSRSDGIVGGVDACQVQAFTITTRSFPFLFSISKGDSGGPMWMDWDKRSLLVKKN